MSEGDHTPSDKALEGGDNADISRLAGFRGHAPKLSPVSRAINPRAQLEAEMHGQSREPEREVLAMPDVQEYANQWGPPGQPVHSPPVYGQAHQPPPRHFPPPPPDPYAYQAPPAGYAQRAAAGDPYAQARPREHSTLPRGMQAVRPPLPPPRPVAPPPPPPVNEDARAWDAYASAALQSLMAMGLDPAPMIEHAGFIADELLEQRRRRFA